MPVSFHIFSGNLALEGDFANVDVLDARRTAKVRRVARDEARSGKQEMVGTTVIGCAAGMSPIVDLAGSGVLERHPKLKFVIVESECGWLAWVLQAMDQMQERRYLNMFKLKMRPSETSAARGRSRSRTTRWR